MTAQSEVTRAAAVAAAVAAAEQTAECAGPLCTVVAFQARAAPYGGDYHEYTSDAACSALPATPQGPIAIHPVDTEPGYSGSFVSVLWQTNSRPTCPAMAVCC